MTTLKAMAADLDQDPRAQRRRELPDRDPMARRLRMQDSRGRLSDTVADIESDVVAALGLGQFSLLYQPRMALDSGDVVAVEALLRWQDSARGLLGPKAFLPLVAQTSAMVALGQWVLYEASREAARWELERPAGRQALDEADAYSIGEFCRRHRISVQVFYKFRHEMPATFRVGSRVLVSRESAARWRAAREAATAQSTSTT